MIDACLVISSKKDSDLAWDFFFNILFPNIISSLILCLYWFLSSPYKNNYGWNFLTTHGAEESWTTRSSVRSLSASLSIRFRFIRTASATGWFPQTGKNYEAMDASCNSLLVSGNFQVLGKSLTFTLSTGRFLLLHLFNSYRKKREKQEFQKSLKISWFSCKFFQWVFKPFTFLMISLDWNELESSAWSQNDRLSKGFTHQRRNNLILLSKMSQIMYV